MRRVTRRGTAYPTPRNTQMPQNGTTKVRDLMKLMNEVEEAAFKPIRMLASAAGLDPQAVENVYAAELVAVAIVEDEGTPREGALREHLEKTISDYREFKKQGKL